jgi:hypothetical protein
VDEERGRPIREQWTIDEILDDVARLAVCRARDSRPVESLRIAIEPIDVIESM